MNEKRSKRRFFIKQYVKVTPCQYNIDQKRQNTQTCQKAPNRKQKRPQDTEAPFNPDPAERRKRARTSVADESIEENLNGGAISITNEEDRSPVRYWSRHGRWPEEYFKEDEQTWEYLNRDLEEESWFEKYGRPNISHLLARKRSLVQKKSDTSSRPLSSTTPSDEKPRDAKSALYARPAYATILGTKGSFMNKSDRGITNTSKDLYSSLLEKEQTVPFESLFRNDLFERTCRNIGNRNEAMVIRDITLLIVPSAQTFATYGAKHLEQLTESVNEGWNSGIPVYGPRSQPDYSVGFGRSAFTNKQLEKLKPFVGDIVDNLTSYFMATWRMYFPFITCEVKCGAAALDIANRQNAHSMTLAVRGLVELFRYVKREKELN